MASDRLLTDIELAQIERIVFQQLAELKFPYHNRAHTEERVVPCAVEYAREANLSPADAELLKVAALFHDYGHVGATYRQLVPGVDRPDLSNEEYAAYVAVESTKQFFSPDQLKNLKNAILATSFGQNQFDKLPAEHASKLYRAYKPESNLEKLLAFADVSNYRWGLQNFIQDNLNVVSESGESGIPANFDAFISTRIGFLGYVQNKLDEVKPLFSETFAVGLQEQLDTLRAQLQNLKPSSSEDYVTWSTEFEGVREARLRELKS